MKLSVARHFMLVSLALTLAHSAWSKSPGPLQNQLLDHPAPYLALHGEDPVAWQEWGEPVVARARGENRILMISVGYFSCHWCHVMQAESYRDPEIAEFLNTHFLPVKVDRELEPALDSRLMDFTQRILGRGGWPLNVFVTPEGHPVYSVLYAPPGEFLSVLKRMQEVWFKDAAGVRELVAVEEASNYPDVPPILEEQVLSNLLEASIPGILSRADTLEGGSGEQQKFPSVPQLRYLLEAYKIQADAESKAFLELTLSAMANNGLYDHLAGGFFRYAVDPGWEIPHFEKMLYDNAELAGLYLDAGRAFGRPDLEAIGHQTLTFIIENMWRDSSGFISSFSAVDE